MLHEIFKGMDNAAEQINDNFKGLIIEYGENERGKWAKFPGGLTYCETTIPINQTTSSPIGSIFRTSEPITALYPVDFIERPIVGGSLNVPIIAWFTPGSGPIGWTGVRVYSPVNNQVVEEVKLYAIGMTEE